MPKPTKGTLPAFTPVPREKERSNGLTPEIQQAFIEALADTGSVRSACRAVGRSDTCFYLLRRHPEAKEFRKAWEAALKLGVQKIEDVAMDRALHGVEVPVYSYGKLIGTRTVVNDRLLMFMLRNRAPKRFTEGRARSLNAVDAAKLKRLKAQWRKEWEREEAQTYFDAQRQREESMCRLMDDQHRRWYLGLGPAGRAAYRTFRQADLAERAGDYEWVDAPGSKNAPAEVAAEYDAEFALGKDRRSRLQRVAEMLLLGGPASEGASDSVQSEAAPDDEPEPPKRPVPRIIRI